MFYLIIGVLAVVVLRYPLEVGQVIGFGIWLCNRFIAFLEYLMVLVYVYRYQIILIAGIAGYIWVCWPDLSVMFSCNP